MALITEEVEVLLHSRNIKNYEDLGYNIPRRKDKKGRINISKGTTININVNDLSKGSHIIVKIKCDECGKEMDTPWRDYKKCVHDDGRYYCQNCATKLFGGENIRISLLKKGKSFEQWCVENSRQDILDRWDYELNNYKPNEISCKTSIKCYFKCPQEIHEAELKSVNNLTSNKQKNIDCKRCNSFAQWGIDNISEDFLEKYWDYDKNIVNPWEISRGTPNNKVWIKCQDRKDHVYKITCNDFLSGSGCPECNKSKSEKVIADYLRLKHIIYISQKEFDGLIGLGGGKLSYDFYLPYYNMLIEYDGEFHYKPIRFYKGEPIKYAEKRFKKQQEHDKLKNEYAEKNSIKLLRIPYWDFDNIEEILDLYFKRD